MEEKIVQEVAAIELRIKELRKELKPLAKSADEVGISAQDRKFYGALRWAGYSLEETQSELKNALALAEGN